MYLETNNLFNQCADTMQGQFALNMRFLDSVFQSQKRWVDRAIDHQQQLQKVASKSDDLVKMSESAQMCMEGVVDNWLADCEEVCQTMHQHSQEVSDFYRSSVDNFEEKVSEQSLSNEAAEKSAESVKKANPDSAVARVAKTKRSSSGKTAVKKPVANTPSATASAQAVKKSIASRSSAKKSVKPVAPKTKAPAARTAPVEKQLVAKKVAVKAPVKKAAASKVVADTVQPIVVDKKPVATVSKGRKAATSKQDNPLKV